MAPHYAGYFNPATATIPTAPLLIVVLLPAIIWLAIKILRMTHQRMAAAIWLGYGSYTLLVAWAYWDILEWRWAAQSPADYRSVEGRVSNANPAPAGCDRASESTQYFTINGIEFVAPHQRWPIIDFLIPRMRIPWLPFGRDAAMRVTYRDGVHGPQLLNVEIDANALQPKCLLILPKPDFKGAFD